MAGNSSGGDIMFTNSGNVATKKDGSTGINIMSLGGGGGSIYGVATSTSKLGILAPKLDINASGGDITAVNSAAIIKTDGDAADAFTVVSGGGGWIYR